MKKAMEATREGLAKYRSFGDMLDNDPKFADRKRNRDKDYSHTPKRSDLEDEIRSIFGHSVGSAMCSQQTEQLAVSDCVRTLFPTPFARQREQSRPLPV